MWSETCIIFTFNIFFIILKVSEIHAADFDYENQTEWGKEYPKCNGFRQSPINIYTYDVVPSYIPQLKFVNYDRKLPGKFTLQNNGHSVSLKIDIESDSRRPYITGGLLKNEYIFHELHFHWGKNNNEGSEHTIDANRFPLEMHVVHRNKLYSFEEAVNHGDGLSVVAVFFKVSQQTYYPLNNIIDYFPNVSNSGQIINIPNFSLQEFFPYDKNFFNTYMGSLTTPPCAESVIWNIMLQPLPISSCQLKEFRLLLDNKNQPIAGNFRKTQPLHGRKVYKKKYYK